MTPTEPTGGDRGVGDRVVALDAPRCAGVVIEHVDGTSECELGSRCRVGLDDHDVGVDCPGPEHDCAHCRSVFSRCEAPVIEHGPGDGTGPLVCTAGHDAEDLDPAEDTDRADARVYHPGTETYPCARVNCPRCAATGTHTPTG